MSVMPFEAPVLDEGGNGDNRGCDSAPRFRFREVDLLESIGSSRSFKGSGYFKKVSTNVSVTRIIYLSKIREVRTS